MLPNTTKVKAAVLAVLIYYAALRSNRAEDFFDFKVMYYLEDDDRMQIISPSFLYQHQPTPDLTIKLEMIYNSISGASPSGLPDDTVTTVASTPVTISVPAPSPSPVFYDDDEYDDDEHDDDDDDRRLRQLRGRKLYKAVSGATPAATTPASTTPAASTTTIVQPATTSTTTRHPTTGDVEDTRVGGYLEVSRRLDRHTISSQLSFSDEDDYTSLGLALRDSIGFNGNNTFLLVGIGGSADEIDAVTMPGPDDKRTIDFVVGVTHLLNPQTIATANFGFARLDGYLTDPYKYVELNGAAVQEFRPDSKDRWTIYLSTTRLWESLNASTELSYRYYSDSFGVDAHTFSLAWYQRFGERLIVRPAARIYSQGQADFYAVRFTGEPDHYSSDYRLSELTALGYGLKVIWPHNDRFSVDLAVERYQQTGRDSETPDWVYPSANIITGGLRWSL